MRESLRSLSLRRPRPAVAAISRAQPARRLPRTARMRPGPSCRTSSRANSMSSRPAGLCSQRSSRASSGDPAIELAQAQLEPFARLDDKGDLRARAEGRPTSSSARSASPRRGSPRARRGLPRRAGQPALARREAVAEHPPQPRSSARAVPTSPRCRRARARAARRRARDAGPEHDHDSLWRRLSSTGFAAVDDSARRRPSASIRRDRGARVGARRARARWPSRAAARARPRPPARPR